MAERKKITKKTLAKSFHHWYYGHLTCFSQEHMQTFGYLTSMLPIVEELYIDKAEQKEAMQTLPLKRRYNAAAILGMSISADTNAHSRPQAKDI